MAKTSPKNQISQQIVTLLCLVVVTLSIAVVALLLKPATIISTFEQCKKAGGAIMESYPEQCMINKTSFTNPMQQLGSSDDYIGLTEKDALAKAEASNTPARVVERDGQGLPVTMDFTFGRHNLYVKDGKVYKVEIEGQATDN